MLNWRFFYMGSTKNVLVTAETGIHARPATALVNKAAGFSSDIKIEYNGKTANLKSIMGVMSLGIPKNANIKVIADGEDQDEAVEGIYDLFKQEGLGE